jgi:hypothetical protein
VHRPALLRGDRSVRAWPIPRTDPGDRRCWRCSVMPMEESHYVPVLEAGDLWKRATASCHAALAGPAPGERRGPHGRALRRLATGRCSTSPRRGPLLREVDEILIRRPGPRRVRPAGQRPAGRAFPRPGFPGSGGIIADGGRASPAADAGHSPDVPGDRREMFPSRHIVKSEAMSLCRKLEASSRSQAGARSRELGLLEG